MSAFVSRRGILATLAGTVLAPLATKLRAAFGGAQETSGAAGPSDPEQRPCSVAYYTYDDVIRQTAEIESNGMTKTYIYDKQGRLISLIDAEPAEVTTYSYDV